VNANDLTFGVELETMIPASVLAPSQVGHYHSGRQVEALPAGWTAQRDCSIHADAGCTAVEVVSPILKGIDGLKQVKAVCDWLNASGAKVNKSCGFHVHVGFDRSEKQGLKRLVSLTANFEKALLAATGTHNRDGNHFCKRIQDSAAMRTFGHTKRTAARNPALRDRYHVLNLSNVLGFDKPTVEFRVFAGTTNAVRACLALVEKALTLKKLPKWTAKTPKETSPIHRSGEGQTAFTRLFYALG
jgi:hypothetical protein